MTVVLPDEPAPTVVAPAAKPKQKKPQATPQAVGVTRGGWFVRITILVVVLIWLIPTLGVLITSFRPQDARQHAPAGGRSSPTPSMPGSGHSRTTGPPSTPRASATPS